MCAHQNNFQLFQQSKDLKYTRDNHNVTNETNILYSRFNAGKDFYIPVCK